jgi:DNA damage-binding protein 1
METSNPKGKQRAENVNEEDEVSSNRGTVAKMTGSVIEVVQTFPGLSPIVDATIADVDGSGQQAVVVCSGGQGAGAIKVVRKGAELKEYATVDGFDNIVDVWSLKPHLENEYVEGLAC